MSGFRVFAAAALLAAGSGALAGPPYFTDDPDPVDYGHIELYLAAEYAGTTGVRSGTCPHVEINVGALPNLQLHTIVPLAFNRPSHARAVLGMGDVELGAKYRFVQEGRSIPMCGTFVLVETPTGSAARGLGNGKTQVFIPIWVQKSRGAWTSYGGGGYWMNAAAGSRNWWFTGWHLERDLSRVHTLGFEAFYRTPDTPGGSWGVGFNVGGQANASGNWHLLYSAGRDIRGPDRLTAYLGVQYTR